MRLFIAEKPSVALDIARALSGAKNPPKRESCYVLGTDCVTWCFGHLFEMLDPDEYDPRYKEWVFADLPIVPHQFRLKVKRTAAGQLRAIGQLLKECSMVVLATDADREGECIGREVLEHHHFSGEVKRLWLSSFDQESVKEGIANLRPGDQMLPFHHAAVARARADWLVGMSMSRAVTIKKGRDHGAFSIGRVQTPTVAIVVRRDREIANFTPRDFFEVLATLQAENGKSVKLKYAPGDKERIFDPKRAEEIALQLKGKQVKLDRETKTCREAPPLPFSQTRLQAEANARWGWPVAKTLEVAQALYEVHKAASYPRTECEYLEEKLIADVGPTTSALVRLPEFKHLADVRFTPRNTVFNSKKVDGSHYAIIPTKIDPPIGAMSADEHKLYLLIAARYIATLLPDYEYERTEIWATVDVTVDGSPIEIKLKTSGNIPGKPGWKAVVAGMADGKPDEDQEGDQEGDQALPDIPNGVRGEIIASTVAAKRTKAPAAFTEGTLVTEMKMVAKYATDPVLKERLKDADGIGTGATRASIIQTIKDREYVTLKGKKLTSTQKGRDLIELLERELPPLADPVETAIWEDRLLAIEKGRGEGNAFVAEIAQRVSEYVSVLASKPDAPTVQGPEGTPTGVHVGSIEILDHGEFFTARGGFVGRIYKNTWGHTLTADEVRRLVAGREILELADCTKRDGSPLGPTKIRYNPDKKPYPGVEQHVATQATGVATEAKRGKGGAISIAKAGDKEYYLVEGYVAGGYPVKFWKRNFNRDITPEELEQILKAGQEGVRLDGFVANDGTKFAKWVRYNARKKPYPGLEFAS